MKNGCKDASFQDEPSFFDLSEPLFRGFYSRIIPALHLYVSKRACTHLIILFIFIINIEIYLSEKNTGKSTSKN